MKKMISIILALALACLTFGCSNGKTPSASESVNPSGASGSTGISSAEPKAEKYKIAVFVPTAQKGWTAATAYYAETYCASLGENVEYKVVTSSNAKEMTNQIEDLKAWGMQAAVVYSTLEEMQMPLKACVDAGIKVVSLETKFDVESIYRVSGDNESMGAVSAQYIVDKIGKKGNIVLLNAPTAGMISEEREGGFMDKLAEIAPDMKVETYSTTLTREDGQKNFSEILSKTKKIDAVYAMDDEIATGVFSAIQAAKRTDIKTVIGGGGAQEYFKLISESKDISLACALYSPEIIKDAIDTAISVLRDEKPAVQQKISSLIVDKENCEDYLDISSPY